MLVIHIYTIKSQWDCLLKSCRLPIAYYNLSFLKDSTHGSQDLCFIRMVELNCIQQVQSRFILIEFRHLMVIIITDEIIYCKAIISMIRFIFFIDNTMGCCCNPQESEHIPLQLDERLSHQKAQPSNKRDANDRKTIELNERYQGQIATLQQKIQNKKSELAMKQQKLRNMKGVGTQVQILNRQIQTLKDIIKKDYQSIKKAEAKIQYS